MAAIVHVRKSRQLAELLHGSGGPCERLINGLGNCASPENPGMTTCEFPDGTEAGVAADLTALLARARAAGHPAAGEVEGILAQLGAEVPAAEPEPAPEPVTPPVPPPPAA